MDKVISNKKAICIFILPAFIVFTFMVIIPIVASGYFSLLDWNGISKGSFIGFKNYVNLFVNNNDGFTGSVYNSIILAVLSLVIQLPISLTFALILAKGIKGEKVFRTLYFIPVVISTVVIGQLWLKIYNPSYGLLNTFLKGIGLGMFARGWLSDISTALGSVFVPLIWQYIGYHMLLMYAFAKSIPAEIFEAAAIDGATGVQADFRITIPLMKPMLKTCITLAVVGSLKIFDLVYVMTNGGPAHATEVPSTIMVTTVFQSNMFGYGSSMAVFIIIECLVFTLIIQKYFKTDEIN